MEKAATQTGYNYLFSGSAGGETVEGSIFFADEGGYLIRSSHGTCDLTDDSRGAWWSRSQEGSRVLQLACQGIRLRMTLDPDGEIRNGVATIKVKEFEERRGRCAEYDPNTGACLSWHWRTVPVTRSYDGPVTFTSG